MTHFTRLLLSGTAALGLLFSACQAKSDAPAAKLADDVSKDEMVAMMKDAMVDAKATSGSGSPAMWTFSDEDTTVYLYGTVHLLKPSVTWRSPALDAALAEADTLVLEADVASPESAAGLQRLVMEYGVFSDGQSLSGLLEDDDEAVVSAALQANGIPMQAVDTMKPWMVGLQLSMMQIMQAGYDPQSGVETVLMADAKDKKLAYLETAETQIKALGGAPLDEQVQGLMATLSSMELGEEYLDTLVAEWADGDVKGIGALMANPAMFGTQDSYDALLTTRNKNWVPGIKALLNEPGTKLVAVGAGHLAGPDSVVKMLKKDGIKVKAVK
ncbi:TraB/GumN family protein [Hellea balneolensis]|uniref:TraB/GumN family protein n=1 Tax=Hellea balneolensis TaxID=287478 RepID=UPI0004281968|nr:TraB/GumN family protein [Hellea balneolensis]